MAADCIKSMYWVVFDVCRGWLINPMEVTYWWIILLSIVPALLATILIFLDQQITAVIVNRKEHKLQVNELCSLKENCISFVCSPIHKHNRIQAYGTYH